MAAFSDFIPRSPQPRVSSFESGFRFSVFAILFVLACFGDLSRLREAAACPFCKVVGPTLSQQRDEADVFALGEVAGDRSAANLATVQLHQVHHGAELLDGLQSVSVRLPAETRPGTLVALFGRKSAEPGEPASWEAVPVDEIGYAYIVQAPATRTPADARLRWFARWLEHPNALLAEDAYREFGQAPLDAVVAATDALPLDKFRSWILDSQIPQERKGFYAVALGLSADSDQRRQNVEFLRQRIEAPADDFRAGFDGVVGGYLFAAGEEALHVIETQLLTRPDAPIGDVRHTITALRVYRQYGREISAERIDAALVHLLARPEVAATVVVDLARAQAWEYLDEIAALFGREGYGDHDVERAVAGYLLVCPLPAAQKQLERMRRQAPVRVEEAQRQVEFSGGPGAS